MTGTTFPAFTGGPDEGGPSYQNRDYQQQPHYQNQNNQGQQDHGQGQRQWGNNQGQYQGNNNGSSGSNHQNNSGSSGDGNRGNWNNQRNGNWNGQRSGGGFGGNGGGSGGKWGGGNGGGFQKKRPEETDLTLYKPYAIAANPDAPPEILAKFQEIALFLESRDYTARIDGKDGVSAALEKTIKKFEMHLPWRGFGDKESRFYYNTDRAFAVAKMFHPTFDNMKKGIQAFLAGNARLIMGDKMVSPVLFFLCWTEDGAESIKSRTSRTGFTGHPIAIASALGIPVFNLAKPDAQQRLTFLVESTSDQN